MAATCAVDGCGNNTSKGGSGLCGMHYARRRRGKPVGGPGYVRDPRRSLEARVFSRLEENPSTGCWEWTGALRNGYGAVGVGRKVVYVHRWVYEHLVAKIPDGLVMDHHCLNRACANPDHLDVVTKAVNNARGGYQHGARKAAS